MVTYLIISSLLNALMAGTVAWMVHHRARGGLLHGTYTLACLSAFVWSTGYLLWHLSTDPRWALFFCRVLMAGAIFMPVFYFHHMVMFLGESRPRAVQFAYGTAILFLLFDLTPWFITGVYPKAPYRWWPRAGPLYDPYLILFVLFAIYLLSIVVRAWLKAKGQRRAQLQYTVIADVIVYLGSGTNFFMWYDIPIHPYGNIGLSVYYFLTIYAMFRHRLLDLNLAVRDWAAFAFAGAGTAMAMWLISLPWVHAYPIPVCMAAALLTGWLTPMVYPAAKRGLQRLVRGGKYFYLEEIKRISEGVFRWTNLPELLKHLVQDLTDQARLSWAGVWLYDLTEARFVLRHAGHKTPEHVPQGLYQVSFSSMDDIIRLFQSSRGLMMAEELFSREGTHVNQELARRAAVEMGRVNIAAAMPIYLQNKLIGFLGFSSKDKGFGFNQADIMGLESLGQRAELAIGQAFLQYEQSLMLSKLAHDTLNFLNGLGLAMETLSDEFASPLNDFQKRQIFIAKQQVELIKESLVDLRELERLVSLRVQGKWEIDAYNLAEVVESAVKTYESRAEQKNVRFELQLEAKAQALGDRRAVRRVVDNLLINALKFTTTGGVVYVRLRPLDKNIELTVRDTGPGIPPAEIDHVFAPFYQGPSRQSLAQGTGLGLAVVKEVVNLHKGTVRVQSELGKGAEFIVELPTIERRTEFEPNSSEGEPPEKKAA